MKKFGYLLSSAVLIGILFTVGCKGKDDPQPSAEELQQTAMTKTWAISTATLDGTTVTDLSGFELTVTSAFGYTTNAGEMVRMPNPWPTSGTFAFGEKSDGTADITKVIREDGLVMSLTIDADGTTMSLSFNFVDGTHSQTGRTEAIAGDWVFGFTAK